MSVRHMCLSLDVIASCTDSAFCTCGSYGLGLCRMDVWPELHPGDPGITYDGPGNPMLSHSFTNRLDRIFVKSAGWKAESIEMVGREAIPGLSYSKRVRGKEKRLPVLPSDHYGLLLRLKRGAGSKENLAVL